MGKRRDSGERFDRMKIKIGNEVWRGSKDKKLKGETYEKKKERMRGLMAASKSNQTKIFGLLPTTIE